MKKIKNKKPAAKKKKKIIRKVKKKPIKRVVKKTKKPVKIKRESLKKKSAIEPGMSLEEVGCITHYFPHVEAAVVKLEKGSLKEGDTIIIKGHTTDFKEIVNSMQLDHVSINEASKGQEIGLGVKSKVREGDIVYKVIV